MFWTPFNGFFKNPLIQFCSQFRLTFFDQNTSIISHFVVQTSTKCIEIAKKLKSDDYENIAGEIQKIVASQKKKLFIVINNIHSNVWACDVYESVTVTTTTPNIELKFQALSVNLKTVKEARITTK